jgi:transposase
VDRDLLDEWLQEGLSLAAIGRLVDKHESTVGHWVLKHGLKAAHRDRHVAKGHLDEPELKRLVEAGMSVAEMASAVGRSRTAVRHWLREYGLRTQWSLRREASAQNVRRLVLNCERHGLTTFVRVGRGGYRCGKCRSEAVTRRRRRVKATLVEEAGGKCVLCGYDTCLGALAFHHLDPSEKRFSLSQRGVTRSLQRARTEADKCLLLCGNCHAEVEAGVTDIDPALDTRVECDSRSGTAPGQLDPG